MRVGVVCLICVILAASSASCPSYSCSSNLPATQCISVSGNATNVEVEVASCGDYTHCPLVQQGTSACQPDELPRSHPGDFCGSSEECGTNICLDTGVCSGASQGNNCSAVYDCNPGLACNAETLTCAPQGIEGSSCMQTYDCQNNLICNLGFCFPYFSTPNGMPTDAVENIEIGLSLACTSGFAVQDNEAWICAAAPVSSGTLPNTCEVGVPGQCPDQSGNYSSACLCGYNPSGSSYCSLFPGDPAGVYMIANLTILTGLNEDCNTFSRFSFNCFAKEELRGYLNTYYSYALNFALLTSNAYPLTVSNPPCVQSVFTSDYWELTSDLENYKDAVCPRYFCTNSTYGWTPKQCISYQNQIFDYLTLNLMLLSPCPDNTTQCAPTYLQNSTCTAVTGNAFPGDYCDTNSDCLTKQCSNNTCLGGFSSGTSCINVYDCNPGLFCNLTSLICMDQVGVGMPCESDFDCENYMGCNIGRCVVYFSLANGMETDSLQSSGFAELCASGYASLTNVESLFGVCANAPVSPSIGPTRCVPGTMCFSMNKVSSKLCACGYNSDGSSYCPLFEGDTPMVLARYNVIAISVPVLVELQYQLQHVLSQE